MSWTNPALLKANISKATNELSKAVAQIERTNLELDVARKINAETAAKLRLLEERNAKLNRIRRNQVRIMEEFQSILYANGLEGPAASAMAKLREEDVA